VIHRGGVVSVLPGARAYAEGAIVAAKAGVLKGRPADVHKAMAADAATALFTCPGLGLGGMTLCA